MRTLRFDSSASLSWRGAISSATSFFAWWREQLWEAVPPRWRRPIASAFGRWTIVLDGERWRIRAPDEDYDAVMFDPASRDEIDSHLTRLDRNCFARRVTARIAQTDALIRHIRLPAAAERRLHSVVHLQLDRLSPFRPEDVRFDCRRIGVETEGEIEVEVAIVPKAALREYEERLAGLGFSVGWFQLSDLPLGFAPVHANLTSHERTQFVLGVVAAAAFVAAIALAPFMRTLELENLTAQNASLRAPALEAAALRDSLLRARAPLIVVANRLGGPDELDILRELTALLPDDSRLSDLEIDGRNIRLRGSSRTAGEVVALLARSGWFAHVALRGPVGRGADGRDRFEIDMLAVRTPAEPGGGQR